MKRAAIVSSATVAGLVGVAAFHTVPTASGLTGLAVGAATSTTTAQSTTGSTSNTTGQSTTSTSPPASTTTSPRRRTTTTTTSQNTKSTTTVGHTTTTVRSTPTTVATSPSTTTTVSNTPRTAVGEVVNYFYGTLSVSVSAQGKKITNVTIGSLNDGGNFRSQSIDQQSIPILEQEAMTAQGASIQSVSGASYTSAGFIMSLQSALSKLGL